MRRTVLLTLLLSVLSAGAAHGAEVAPAPVAVGAATPRELFLASAIALMMAPGLASFFLAGRIGERTHVALALLGIPIGGFCLFALFALAGREYPAAGALVVLGLIGLFKLMNQFEIRRKPERPPTVTNQ